MRAKRRPALRNAEPDPRNGNLLRTVPTRGRRSRGCGNKRQLREILARARDEGHARQRRIEQETLRSRKRYASHTVQCRDPALIVIAERCGIAAETRAQVNVSGQDARQPIVERLPERRDHDRHRYHQRDTGDDRRQAHDRLSRRAAELIERERRRDVTRPRRQRKEPHDDARQQQQRADEKKRDGSIAEQRQTRDRRHKRRETAGSQQNCARDRASQSRKGQPALFGFERGRRRRVCGIEARDRAARHCGDNTQRDERQRRCKTDVQLRRYAAKESGTQVAAEVFEGELRQQVTDRQTL